MKILQISTYYPPNFGGIEMVAYDFSRILLRQGHEVKVLCFNHGVDNIIDSYEGIEVYRVGYHFKISSQAISFQYFITLKRILKEFKPDVIHIHLPNPLIATYLMMAKPQCKVTIHWHSDIIRQKLLKGLYGPFERSILKRADKIVATSQIYVDKSASLHEFVNKISIIPNIVETEFLDNVNESNKNTIERIKQKYAGKKIIFSIGVHREYKGLKYLIDAAQYLSDEYIIVIAGYGVLTEKLRLQAEELKLQNVAFIGRISDEEKKCFLWASEIYAFPSITKNEAFGIALAEGLYCGLPSVTFTIEGSGVNWVNKDGVTGIEVHERDAKQYAQALMNVSKEKYGAAAREWVKQNFTEEAIYDKVKDFFEF